MTQSTATTKQVLNNAARALLYHNEYVFHEIVVGPADMPDMWRMQFMGTTIAMHSHATGYTSMTLAGRNSAVKRALLNALCIAMGVPGRFSTTPPRPQFGRHVLDDYEWTRSQWPPQKPASGQSLL